jgi:hypothetical protein
MRVGLTCIATFSAYAKMRSYSVVFRNNMQCIAPMRLLQTMMIMADPKMWLVLAATAGNRPIFCPALNIRIIVQKPIGAPQIVGRSHV